MYSRAFLGFALDLAHKAGRRDEILDEATIAGILAGAEAASKADYDQDRDGWPTVTRTFKDVIGSGLFEVVGEPEKDWLFASPARLGIPVGETTKRELRRNGKFDDDREYDYDEDAQRFRVYDDTDWAELTLTFRVRPGARFEVNRIK